MLTNCSITVYNKYIDKITLKECYKKTIIQKANWQGQKVAGVSTTETGKGVLSIADSINIFIPFINSFSNKTYLSPKAWNDVNLVNRDNYFTFQATDRIVKGECAFEFVPTTNPITNLDKLDNVVSVMSIIINDNGSKALRHYQLGAK